MNNTDQKNMTLDDMKHEVCKNICDVAYTVGFTAKLYYAAYDLLTKGLAFYIFLNIGLCAYMIGLGRDSDLFPFLMCLVGASAIVLGRLYDLTCNQEVYLDVANKQHRLYEELHAMLREVKLAKSEDLVSAISNEIHEVKKLSDATPHPNLFMGCGWYAHYKFFFVQDNGWIKEYRKFSLIKDVVPASLYVLGACVIAGIFAYISL